MFVVKNLRIGESVPYRLYVEYFACSEGDFIGLVGPNGSGKSTFLKALGGLLNSAGSSSVVINTIPLKDLKRREVAQKVAYVPQETEMPVAFSVKEVVSLGRNPYWPSFTTHFGESSWSVQDRALILSALEKMDLLHLQNRTVDSLSGGERQRVLVARALAQDTPAILLDEPIANLDVHHQLELLQLLRREAAEGRTIICALHDLSLASRFCSRLAVLNGGCLVENGAPHQLLSPEFFAKYFKLKAVVQTSSYFEGQWVLPLEPL